MGYVRDSFIDRKLSGPGSPFGIVHCFPYCHPIVNLSLTMSTPPNDERSSRKWFKQKFRSVFSSKSPSRNLDVQDALSTSTIVPPTNASFLAAQARENSPSDTDRTGSGE